MSGPLCVNTHFTPGEVLRCKAALSGRSGIGVSVIAGSLAITIDSGDGKPISCVMCAHQLDLFADNLAAAIEQLNSAEHAALGPSARMH